MTLWHFPLHDITIILHIYYDMIRHTPKIRFYFAFSRAMPSMILSRRYYYFLHMRDILSYFLSFRRLPPSYMICFRLFFSPLDKDTFFFDVYADIMLLLLLLFIIAAAAIIMIYAAMIYYTLMMRAIRPPLRAAIWARLPPLPRRLLEDFARRCCRPSRAYYARYARAYAWWLMPR